MMYKADLEMSCVIDSILRYGYKDVNPRPKYADGTPAYTISINHQVRRYNLDAGEFPITRLTIDDFEMINYDPIKPQLKLELGI